MILLLNLGILAIFLFAGSMSLVLWGWAVGKLYRGEPVLEPEPRLMPQVGLSELMIGFGVMVLVSASLAPVILPKNDLEPASLNTSTSEPSPEKDTATDLEIAAVEPEIDLDVLIATIVLNSIATVVAILAVLVWMKLRGLSFERAGFLPTSRHITLGFAGAVMLLPPVMLLQGLLASQIRYEHPLLEVLQENISWRVMLAMAISASFIAPVVEEIYFRGLLQGFMEKLSLFQESAPEMPLRRPIWPAVVTSLFFALAHAGQGPAPISLFFLALGIAYLYRQTGSIWPGLIIHFVLNATSTGTMIIVTLIGAPVD